MKVVTRWTLSLISILFSASALAAGFVPGSAQPMKLVTFETTVPGQILQFRKTVKIDSCNLHSLHGSFKELTSSEGESYLFADFDVISNNAPCSAGPLIVQSFKSAPHRLSTKSMKSGLIRVFVPADADVVLQ